MKGTAGGPLGGGGAEARGGRNAAGGRLKRWWNYWWATSGTSSSTPADWRGIAAGRVGEPAKTTCERESSGMIEWFRTQQDTQASASVRGTRAWRDKGDITICRQAGRWIFLSICRSTKLLHQWRSARSSPLQRHKGTEYRHLLRSCEYLNAVHVWRGLRFYRVVLPGKRQLGRFQDALSCCFPFVLAFRGTLSTNVPHILQNHLEILLGARRGIHSVHLLLFLLGRVASWFRRETRASVRIPWGTYSPRPKAKGPKKVTQEEEPSASARRARCCYPGNKAASTTSATVGACSRRLGVRARLAVGPHERAHELLPQRGETQCCASCLSTHGVRQVQSGILFRYPVRA